MIVIDASALLAIVLDEPEGFDFSRALTHHDCVIGASTVIEAQLAATSRSGPQGGAAVRRILTRPNIEIVAFTDEHARVAFDAFERYGRGRHPARLNFGDCMAYAVAKLANAPLLYKGDDFSQTDIKTAFPQGAT